MSPSTIAQILTFLRQAEMLKSTLRASYTSTGRRESSAEHSWRLCLFVLLVHSEFPEAQLGKMLSLALVHDLAEAVCGDTPAPEQKNAANKCLVERQSMLSLCAHLPEKLQTQLIELFDDYQQGHSLEAQLVKALDKLETLLQHTQGQNPPDFDYAFNLEYGKKHTQIHPFLRQLRKEIDGATQERLPKN